MLNTPKAALIVLALVLAVNGLLFYRYRLSEPTTATPSQSTYIEATSSTAYGGRTTAAQPPEKAEATVPAAPTKQPTEPAGEKPPGNQQAPAGEVVRVTVRVSDAPSWLSIRTDGALAYEQTASPGFSQTFEVRDSISIQTGNAGAVEVEANGRNLGTLGAEGEVLTRNFSVVESDSR